MWTPRVTEATSNPYSTSCPKSRRIPLSVIHRFLRFVSWARVASSAVGGPRLCPSQNPTKRKTQIFFPVPCTKIGPITWSVLVWPLLPDKVRWPKVDFPRIYYASASERCTTMFGASDYLATSPAELHVTVQLYCWQNVTVPLQGLQHRSLCSRKVRVEVSGNLSLHVP